MEAWSVDGGARSTRGSITTERRNQGRGAAKVPPVHGGSWCLDSDSESRSAKLPTSSVPMARYVLIFLVVCVCFTAAGFVVAALLQIKLNSGGSAQTLLLETRLKDCATCPELVVVPAGSFLMGSPKTEGYRNSRETQVPVTIPKPIALARNTLTRCQFPPLL